MYTLIMENAMANYPASMSEPPSCPATEIFVSDRSIACRCSRRFTYAVLLVDIWRWTRAKIQSRLERTGLQCQQNIYPKKREMHECIEEVQSIRIVFDMEA